MQQQTPKKHAEQLALQNNAPEILNLPSSELIHTEQIGKSALHYVRLSPENEEEKWFIAIGKHRITEYYKTKDELTEYIEQDFWRFLIDVVVTITDETIRNTQTIQETVQEALKLNKIQ